MLEYDILLKDVHSTNTNYIFTFVNIFKMLEKRPPPLFTHEIIEKYLSQFHLYVQYQITKMVGILMRYIKRIKPHKQDFIGCLLSKYLRSFYLYVSWYFYYSVLLMELSGRYSDFGLLPAEIKRHMTQVIVDIFFVYVALWRFSSVAGLRDELKDENEDTAPEILGGYSALASDSSDEDDKEDHIADRLEHMISSVTKNIKKLMTRKERQIYEKYLEAVYIELTHDLKRKVYAVPVVVMTNPRYLQV